MAASKIKPLPTETGATAVSLRGKLRVTRADWIMVANDVLVSQGIDQVKILALSERLQVSRSSFYGYFKSRQALLDALLDAWREANTRSIVDACAAPADTITGSVCNLFHCFVDGALFDPQLDFAIRDWSRRSGRVRRVVDDADVERLTAVATMFKRHGYAPEDAEIRARILYYMQIGYYALELSEPLEQRLAALRGYLVGFTGREPSDDEVTAFAQQARAAHRREKTRDRET